MPNTALYITLYLQCHCQIRTQVMNILFPLFYYLLWKPFSKINLPKKTHCLASNIQLLFLCFVVVYAQQTQLKITMCIDRRFILFYLLLPIYKFQPKKKLFDLISRKYVLFLFRNNCLTLSNKSHIKLNSKRNFSAIIALNDLWEYSR